MDAPIGIQRLRIKGWRMPANTLNVTRPGKWGNPFRVVAVNVYGQTEWHVRNSDGSTVEMYHEKSAAMLRCLECYESWLDEWIADGAPIHELRGKNLACFCRVGDPCHREILLRKANQ